MKKNISINISGVIFHIEEDGYDQLRQYLDSINRYFSSYEDSQEIIADIENRIAEIFTEKLTVDKQVITAEDVAALIATMGTTTDFKAVEEEGDKFYSTTSGYTINDTNTTSSSTGPKKLFRDIKRKLLGGVAAGFGGYIGVDPIWIRLAIIAVFFGISFIPTLSGFTALVYIVLWIVLPGSESIEEEESVKKLYRDPDKRVISGLCSGLAAYFGTDVSLIRVLFVIGLFLGGSTIILYIVLWAITPEAHTITEKMKMQGEPVTLSNIEMNIKKNLNFSDDKDENTITKILLLPFKAIALIFTALGTALGPILLALGEIVRVFFSIILILISVSIIVALATAAAIILGYTDTTSLLLNLEVPFESLIAGIPKLGSISLLVALSIPMLFLGFAGVSLLAKKSVINRAFSLTLLGVFVLSVIGVAITLPGFVKDFQREARVERETVFPIIGKTLFLKGNPNDDMEFTEVDLYLRGYSGKDVKLVKKYSARGRSKQAAMENIEMIQYDVYQKDSSLTFDWNYSFKDNAVFRFQELDLTLYIPYGQEFYIDDAMGTIIKSNIFHGDEYHYYVEGNRWVFEQDGMKCLDCTDKQWDNNDNDDTDYNFNFHSSEDSESIEAEDYESMRGVETEESEDTGGGRCLGYIDDGDWMSYKIEVPEDGIYTIKYRIASMNGEGKIRLETRGGREEFGKISIPGTDGWQNWRTISHTVRLRKDIEEIVLVAEEGGFNLNWFSLTKGVSKVLPQDNHTKKEDHSFNLDFNDEDESITGPTRTYRLTDFTGLSISGLFLINVIRGDDYKVNLSGSSEAIDDLNVDVRGDELTIDTKDNRDNNWKNKGKRVRVDITMPRLEELELNGLTKTTVKGFKSERLKVSLNGASYANIEVVTKSIDIDVNGGAKVVLRGKSDNATVDISGAAEFNGYDFVVKNADIDIAGASATKLHVTDFLKIDADGPCDIRYRGTPRIHQDLSILSHIEHEE